MLQLCPRNVIVMPKGLTIFKALFKAFYQSDPWKVHQTVFFELLNGNVPVSLLLG